MPFSAIHSAIHSATEIEVINERKLKDEKHTYTIRAIFEGNKSRYTFHTTESDNIEDLSYLISLDGGKSVHFINNEDDRCHQWTNQEFVQMLGAFLLKTTDNFNVTVSDPIIKKEFERQVKNMHGLPTTRTRLNINFTTSYKFLFLNDILNIERQVDTWLTPNIEGIETQPILQRSWQTTGYPVADKLIGESS